MDPTDGLWRVRLTRVKVKDVTVHIGTEIIGLQLKDLTDQQRVCGLLQVPKDFGHNR